MEKAKAKAEAETKRVLEEARKNAEDKVISKIDTMTKGVISDSLRQKAKETIDKNANKEINKIKDKLKDFDPFKKKRTKNQSPSFQMSGFVFSIRKMVF
ncbi:MAG: hypothetical protein IPK25_13795 [Saprospiraceae bacterium]|nr:hypothetical protein [Saprospiraceae bacterium]